MATVEVNHSTLAVRFTAREKVLGLIRDIEVPRSAVVDVTVEADGLAAVRGFRAPGLALPGRRKVGTWRGGGRRTAVSVSAGQSEVRVQLTGAGYDELLIGMPDAARTAEVVRAGAGRH